MRSLSVHLLPGFVHPDKLAGRTCVVIDVLRATTTITYALGLGASEVVPCLEVDDARRIASGMARGSYLLGGERGGRKIEGFDMGNSPAEYLPDRVAGKSLVFTTTNGTRALLHCAAGRVVLLAAFVNLAAVVRTLHSAVDVDIVCAGTDGEITEEDTLLAGAIVNQLHPEHHTAVNDAARWAWQQWHELLDRFGVVEQVKLWDALRNSRGGRNLVELGFDSDIEDAAMIDEFQIVPRFDGFIGKIL